jgi:hypothetical protein
MVDVIEELCQSAKIDFIDTGIELALEEGRNHLHIASMIASTHNLDFTQALIVKHISDGRFLEVVKPLIQEAVDRGADYESVVPIVTFWRKLHEDKEPLAWLPLHMVSMDRSIPLPSYRAGTSVTHLPSLFEHGTLSEKPSATTMGKSFDFVALPLDQDVAGRCVRSWAKRSNGKFEAKLIESISPMSSDVISVEQLLNLGLECLAGLSPGHVEIYAVSAETTLAMMFGAASNGGAYPPGEFGAYGRLAAWQSIGALAGVDADGTFDDVYKAAKDCKWFSVNSTSKWFHNIAWDFAVVCLRSDKRRIAILAATDED